MNSPQIVFYDSKQQLAERLASAIADRLTKGGVLVLPGGSSPYELITELGKVDLDWKNIDITTTDERCVPLDSRDSNAGQIERLLGEKVVSLWDNSINDVNYLNWPATVTVLGMGSDAHIASLFPGNEIDMGAEGVIEAKAPAEPRERVSLTMKTLLNTKCLILLVIGSEKWALCERILQGEQQDTPLATLFAMAGDKLTLHIAQ